jgi:hypothetical protein
MRPSVTNLPRDIYQSIKNFLVLEISSYEMESFKDGVLTFDGYNWNENQRSWRLFLSISNSGYFYNCIRKELYDFKLNRFYSWNYFTNPDFRLIVLRRMTSPYRQLSLNLSKYRAQELTALDAEILSGCRYVDLSRNGLVSLPYGLHDIYELNLRNSRSLSDISALRTENNGIHIINLWYCDLITNVDNLAFVEELYLWDNIDSVAALGNIPKLCFGINLRNQSQLTYLTNVKYLDLFHESFTDLDRDPPFVLQSIPLSQLVSLRTFNIVVKDVSNLSNLRVLWTFSGNTRINNLSLLQEFAFDCVEDVIDFSHCIHLKKVLFLQDLAILPSFKSSISSITIFNCNVEDASGLAKATNLLKLGYCKGLTNVSHLGNIKALHLYDCSGVENLNGLGKPGQLEVHLSFCYSVRNVSMLGNLQKLTLRCCDNLVDISALSKVPYLDLRGCTNIGNFNGLGKYQKYLNLTGCRNLRNSDLDNFSNVEDLVISSCDEISDVSILTNVIRLTARQCLGFSILLLHGDFVKCDFSSCSNVVEVHVYNHIHMLSTVGASPDMVLYVEGSVKVFGNDFLDLNANWI